MLAAAGFLVPQLFKFREYSSNALLAQQEVPVEVWSQIAIFVTIVEGLRSQIIFKPDAVPGDHGFDPLGFKQKFANSPAALKEMQLKELKNGRLAMIAITGMVAQGLITGKGPLEQLF